MTDWRNKPDRQDYSKSCGRCSGGMLVNGSCTNGHCPSRGGSGLAKAAGAAGATGAAASSCGAAAVPGHPASAWILLVIGIAFVGAVLVMIAYMIRGGIRSLRESGTQLQRDAIAASIPPERSDLL